MLKQILSAASFSKVSLVMKTSNMSSLNGKRAFNNGAPAEGKSIFIGNLPWEITESEISEFFAKYGTVTSVKMMKDNQTGRPRGFGFITLSGSADQAIQELDGKELKGRVVRINEAKPPAPRDPNAPRRFNNRERDFGSRGGDRDFGNRGGDRGDRGGYNRENRGPRRDREEDQ